MQLTYMTSFVIGVLWTGAFVFIQVLIIAHIPPGNPDNLIEYGKIYLNITKQFSEIITGHLFGHTHKDQFQLVINKELRYDNNERKCVISAWVDPR